MIVFKHDIVCAVKTYLSDGLSTRFHVAVLSLQGIQQHLKIPPKQRDDRNSMGNNAENGNMGNTDKLSYILLFFFDDGVDMKGNYP